MVLCYALHLIDDVGHIKQVKLRYLLTREVRQHGEITDMIWSVPEVISSFSRFFELYLGDLILSAHRLG